MNNESSEGYNKDPTFEATDLWAESSASNMASLLSREFGKISDSVAATLAKDLSQSRKLEPQLAKLCEGEMI